MWPTSLSLVYLILLQISIINLAKLLNPYEILGAPKDASIQEIQKIYRKKALKYHPDKNKNIDAAKHMAELNEAYEILSNEEKRISFDKYGSSDIPIYQKIDPTQHFGTFFPHFTFDFEWSTGFYKENSINLRQYEKEILPASQLYPILLVIYAESCALCHKFESIIEKLAEDLITNGIKVYAVNSFRERVLVKRLNAPSPHEPIPASFFTFSNDFGAEQRKPPIVGLVDGKVIPYQSPTVLPTATGLVAFLRDKLIGPRITFLSILDDPALFKKTILSPAQRLLDNRVRVLIVTPPSFLLRSSRKSPQAGNYKPKLRHLVLAYRLRSRAVFGFITPLPDSTYNLLKDGPAIRHLTQAITAELGIKPTNADGEFISLLNDFEGIKLHDSPPSKSYFTVKSLYTTTYVKDVLSGLERQYDFRPSRYLPIVPRLSSQTIFDALCPALTQPSSKHQHLNVINRDWRPCSLLLVEDRDFDSLTTSADQTASDDGHQQFWFNQGTSNETSDMIDRLRMLRYCQRSGLINNLGLGYVLLKKQAKFLDSLLIDSSQQHGDQGAVKSSFKNDILSPALRLAQLETRSKRALLVPILTMVRLPYQEIRYRLDVLTYEKGGVKEKPSESLLYSLAFEDSRVYSYVAEAVSHGIKASDQKGQHDYDIAWCRTNFGPLEVLMGPHYFDIHQTPLKGGDKHSTAGLHHYELVAQDETDEPIRMKLESLLPRVAVGYREVGDEFALGLLRRTLDRLVTYKEFVSQGLDRNDALTVLSVIFSFLFILGGGYFMAYLVRLEEEKIAQENMDYPTKLPNRIVNQDMIFHELKPGTYNALIRLLKPGCRTILILLNEETKDKLLNKFSRIVHPYRKNVSLMFGFVMIDKYITWYRRLLLQVIGNGRKLVINPKNCVGTVLAVNGYRKYYCIYHARHSEPGPGPAILTDSDEDRPDQNDQPDRTAPTPPPSYSSLLISTGFEERAQEPDSRSGDSGISLGGPREPLLNSSSASLDGTVRLRRMQKSSDDDANEGGNPESSPLNSTTTSRNAANPLFLEDLLNAFPDWLDRLFEGTVQRYYIDYWPPMKL